jgi:inhibitor of cysteine peptidase
MHIMRHVWFLSVCVVAMLAVPVISCMPATNSQMLTLTCADFEKQANVTRTVEVAAGNPVTVTLCSNKTTGFSWAEKAQISDTQVLEQTSYKWVAPGETGMVGTAGNEVWTFKGLKAGTSSVYIEYSQPWNGGQKAARTFKLNVIVR